MTIFKNLVTGNILTTDNSVSIALMEDSNYYSRVDKRQKGESENAKKKDETR